jgi:hypothetical protein
MRRRPSYGPQMRTTAELLKLLLEDWWLMPPDLVRLVLGALLAARYSRAVDLKRHCAVMTTIHTDLDSFFARICTPDFCMDLLDDLVTEGLLTRSESSRAQEFLLQRTTKDGAWSDV